MASSSDRVLTFKKKQRSEAMIVRDVKQMQLRRLKHAANKQVLPVKFHKLSRCHARILDRTLRRFLCLPVERNPAFTSSRFLVITGSPDVDWVEVALAAKHVVSDFLNQAVLLCSTHEPLLLTDIIPFRLLFSRKTRTKRSRKNKIDDADKNKRKKSKKRKNKKTHREDDF